jgi:carbohydrate kinase (thermoresistant glucokinase family)
MGTTGAGKSTIGELLAERLGWPFFDGDAFHPAANKEKMSAGVPLTDEDRRPWLQRLHDLILEQLESGTSLIVACSALKQQYRTLLCGSLDSIILVHLTGSEERLAERLAQRTGHFMNPALLQSQLETLEPAPDALLISIENTPEQIVGTIIDAIEGV